MPDGGEQRRMWRAGVVRQSPGDAPPPAGRDEEEDEDEDEEEEEEEDD